MDGYRWNQKSIGEMDRLARIVLNSKEFRLKDIADFSARSGTNDSTWRSNMMLASILGRWLDRERRLHHGPTGRKDSEGRGWPFTVKGSSYGAVQGNEVGSG